MRLLDDADRQLSYAVKLGYGSKREEFADVQKSIKEAKQQIEKGQDSKGLPAKLKGSLQKMKERFLSGHRHQKSEIHVNATRRMEVGLKSHFEGKLWIFWTVALIFLRDMVAHQPYENG